MTRRNENENRNPNEPGTAARSVGGAPSRPGFFDEDRSQRLRTQQEAPQSASHEESPDEVKEHVRNKVRQGVARVAGAVQGFVEEMRKNDLPKKSREAIEKAGETTAEVTNATRKEVRHIRQEMGGSSKKASKSDTESGKSKTAPLPPQKPLIDEGVTQEPGSTRTRRYGGKTRVEERRS